MIVQLFQKIHITSNQNLEGASSTVKAFFDDKPSIKFGLINTSRFFVVVRQLGTPIALASLMASIVACSRLLSVVPFKERNYAHRSILYEINIAKSNTDYIGQEYKIDFLSNRNP
uniref:Uncharacterized protein n=1 Tax=Megaselia scalaris TaxID=36166 RepID=T1H2E3_MEGSC